MGNNIQNGYQRVPSLYLRELRRKTDTRYRTVVTKRKREEMVDQKKNVRDGGGEMNAQSVAEFIISNPNFLDEFINTHVAQDRVRAWLRGPSDETVEAIDTEGDGDVIASAMTSAEASFKGKRHKEAKIRSSSRESRSKIREIKSKIRESRSKSKSKSRSKIRESRSTQKTEDPKRSPSTGEEGSEDAARAEKSSPSVSFEKGSSPEEKKKERESRKVGKRSRKGTTFMREMTEKSFRHRRLLILNRSRLIYPFKHKHEELSDLIDRPVTEPFLEIESHFFPYTEIHSDEINKVFIQMATKLLGKNAFPMAELCYFLSTLKANYHNVEYHNYSHALSHAQSMFWILRKNPGVFTELEMKALLIASIAHDVGHPGLDESYLRKVCSSMEIMYDSPILENHHTQTCFLILQDMKCNVFCNLDSDDYKEVLEDMKHAIISTNVDRYKMQCERLRHRVEAGIDLNKRYVRNSVKSLMMMACDLCGTWKRWDEHKNIVWSLYKEFFNQSDKEMNFGLNSPPYRLRMNADGIPKTQITFMEGIVVPIFRLLSDIFPNLGEINDITSKNLDCWKTYR